MTKNIVHERSASVPTADRRALADELIDELTSWHPRDRVGTFRSWHRGALSLVHLNVLAVLEAEGPLPMRRLAEALDVSDASATGIVDRMELRGLVERRHGTEDRRVVLVRLAEGGAAVFRDLEGHRRERLARLADELTDDDLAGLLAGLRALRAARARLHAATADPATADHSGPGCCGSPHGVRSAAHSTARDGGPAR